MQRKQEAAAVLCGNYDCCGGLTWPLAVDSLRELDLPVASRPSVTS